MTGAAPAPLHWVELSGENLPLGLRELEALLSILEPSGTRPTPLDGLPRFREVPLTRPEELCRRMAFLHGVLKVLGEGSLEELARELEREGTSGRSAEVRFLRGARGANDPDLPGRLGRHYVQGGGSVDLRSPERTFRIHPRASGVPLGGRWVLLEESCRPDRGGFEERRTHRLPFSKPVTLPPSLARALVNLARVAPGGTLLDPLCGTGGILLEAGLLGYRLLGNDRDSGMVRGSLRNLERFSLTPLAMSQGDVSQLPVSLAAHLPADGLVSDPPYGRGSSTGREGMVRVLEKLGEVLPSLLRRGGRFAFVLPQPEPPEGLCPRGWKMEGPPIPWPVHGSLTRYLFVLRRPGHPGRRPSEGDVSTGWGSRIRPSPDPRGDPGSGNRPPGR